MMILFVYLLMGVIIATIMATNVHAQWRYKNRRDKSKILSKPTIFLFITIVSPLAVALVIAGKLLKKVGVI